MKGPRGKSLELPPEVARRFFVDIRAFYRERNPIKRDEIAARRLDALGEYLWPRDRKLRLSDIKELFKQMRDWRKWPLPGLLSKPKLT
jgi:hypothetical protein